MWAMTAWSLLRLCVTSHYNEKMPNQQEEGNSALMNTEGQVDFMSWAPASLERMSDHWWVDKPGKATGSAWAPLP